jgi:hypothetical protein
MDEVRKPITSSSSSSSYRSPPHQPSLTYISVFPPCSHPVHSNVSSVLYVMVLTSDKRDFGQRGTKHQTRQDKTPGLDRHNSDHAWDIFSWPQHNALGAQITQYIKEFPIFNGIRRFAKNIQLCNIFSSTAKCEIVNQY